MVNKPSSKMVSILILFFTFAGYVLGQDIEAIGGPYTKDENTILLFHFEGDYTNDSDSSANGENHGLSQFFPLSANMGLGQCLYLQNDAVDDSSYVTVEGNDALDLYDDWTIEAWFNIQSFGVNNEDHRFFPSVLWKPGDPFAYGNYFMEVKGDVRWLSTGYYSPNTTNWPSIQSPVNLIEPGQWYHATLIRDTKNAVLVQMIHDQDLNLVWAGTFSYDPAGQAIPAITDRPIFIGTNGEDPERASQSAFLDGFLDEIRISNVVRNFAVPPVIANVEAIANQTPEDETYPPIKANVVKIGGSEITSVILKYKTKGEWQEVAMIVGDSLYEASIPKQDPASIVYYYFIAENADGQRSLYPANAENAAPSYLSFAVEQQMTQILDLDFENGSGSPEDKSSYGHQLTMGGFPLYDSEAAAGNYSIALDPDNQDYLEVTSSLIGASEEFTVDFWMKANSFEKYWSFIANKPAIAPNMWGENTFEVLWGAFDDPGRKITAGVWSHAGGNTRITSDSTIVFGKWYRVIVEVRKAPEGDAFAYYIFLELHNENDEVIDKKYAGFNDRPSQSIHPFRLGKAGSAGDWPAFFDGNFDNVKIYNYAQAQISVDAPPNIANVTHLSNQPETTTSYAVNADIVKGIGSDIQNATLVYDAGSGWQELAMTASGDSYSAHIPQQSLHTVVYYYIKAENADGLISYYPAEAAGDHPFYISFAVEESMTETVSLTFEEGSGDPADGTAYGNWVSVYGDIAYSTDAKEGSYSIEFDSSYIEVHTPLAGSSNEFTVDFWFNATTMNKFWSFIVNKPALFVPWWGENTFEILYGAFDDPNWKLTAGVWSHEEGNTRITLPTLIEFEKWYHVVFEVQEAHPDSSFDYIAIFELRNENDEFLSKDYKGLNVSPTQSIYPMLIGKAGGANAWPDYFDGKIDNLKIYNYAAAGLTTDIESREVHDQVPVEFALNQNYPNPFNPTTEIEFSLSKSGKVSLTIFDILGREVRTLVNKEMVPGKYRVNWDGKSGMGTPLASGIYMYRLESGKNIQVKKMVLMK